MDSSSKKQTRGISTITRVFLVLATAAILGACQSGLAPSPTSEMPSSGEQTTLGLRTIAEIPLSSSASRFDYQSLDPTRKQLYIAHMGANLVTVFDIQTREVITDIENMADVHGVLAVPEIGLTFATTTGSHEVAVIDQQSLRVVARMAGGNYPDGLAYAPDQGKLFVSDQFGKAVIVLDAHTYELIDTIDVGGEVGNTRYDPASHQILANVQTRNQVVNIDPKSDQVIARTDVPGCEHPHGLYIDAEARLAFIACEENATMVSVDLNSMQITATLKTGDKPDVLAFDPGLHRLYIAAESGVLTIFEEHGNKVELLAQGMLAPSAHTVAVDPETHRLYFPLENQDGKPVLRIMEPS
jgi:DNA-binding beta-propeller fold protein YncE